ncbi:YegP family protein [Mycobacterium sp.]|uniref:YegP family protein n=1 Tax=Mycobacterium sp. TaxID=1785 RepID=UPI003C760BD4
MLFLATARGLRAVAVRSASAAVSKAFATASRSSGNRWPYLSSVSTADLCPSSFCTTLTLAPSLMAREAETKANAEKGIESVKANAPSAAVVDLTEEPAHNQPPSPVIGAR